MNRTIVAAGIAGFTAVALGAFGAHALKTDLLARGTLETWQTAVLYHLIHGATAASIGVALALSNARPAKLVAAIVFWLVGIVLFSGSLYAIALGAPRILGAITPLGGVAFLIGWALVVASALQSKAPSPSE